MRNQDLQNKRMTVAAKFNPHRIISDEEFCRNMNLIIAYSQIIKGETKRRFVAS